VSNEVPISLLKPHPKNAEYFSPPSEEEYEALKHSIASEGVRDPLKVTLDYTVVAGHVRLEIAKELGLEKVPVQIVDGDPDYLEYLLIADNDERRVCRDPIKKAKRAEFLKRYWGIRRGGTGTNQYAGKNSEMLKEKNSPLKTLDDVAREVGEDVANLKKLLKLNDLIPELQQFVSQGRLSQTAAYSLAFLPPEEQRRLLEVLGESGVCGLSVSEAQELRKELDSARKEKEALNNRLAELEEEKDSLFRQIADLQENLSSVEEEIAEKLGQQYEEKLREALSGLQKQLRESREEAEGLKAKLKELKAKPIEKVVEKAVYKTDPEQEEKLREREVKIALLEAELQELRRASSIEPNGLSEEIERLRAEKKVLEAEVNRGRAASQFTRTVRGLIRQLEKEEPTVENLSGSVDITPYYVEAQRWIGTLERYIRHIRNAFGQSNVIDITGGQKNARKVQ
jgi:ParB family chromosome partitioning protein